MANNNSIAAGRMVIGKIVKLSMMVLKSQGNRRNRREYQRLTTSRMFVAEHRDSRLK